MTQYQDFADLFSFYSRATIQSVKENGELVAGYSQTRQERLLLRDIIRLFQCFIERVKAREVNDSSQIDLNSVCQQTLSLILKDYEDAPECLKEPCSLQFSAVVLEKLKVDWLEGRSIVVTELSTDDIHSLICLPLHTSFDYL